jgi:hypothetical protein
MKIKKEENIRLWEEEDILAAVLQFSSLAMQMENLTKTNQASLRQLPGYQLKKTAQKSE